MRPPNIYTGNAQLDAWIDRVHLCENVFLVVLLWSLSIVVLIQVISRYVFSNSLPWTEEIARLLLVYVTFLGAFLTARGKSYISIDLISRFMPRHTRGFFIVRTLVCCLFYAVLAALAIDVADRTWHQELTTLAVTNGITYAVPAFALVVLCLRSAVQVAFAIIYPAFSTEAVVLEDIN